MSPHEYIDAVRKDPKTAMIPFGIVQEIFDLSRSAVVDRVKAGRLGGVKVETVDAVYRGVTLASLLAYEKTHPKSAPDDVLIAKIEEMIANKLRSISSCKMEDLTLTYGAVMEPLGMSSRNPKDRNTIAHLLGQMSEESAADRKRGFMVSAVVVRKATGEPGPGFYALARTLELLDDEEEEVFWRAQVKAICDFYLQRKADDPHGTYGLGIERQRVRPRRK